MFYFSFRYASDRPAEMSDEFPANSVRHYTNGKSERWNRTVKETFLGGHRVTPIQLGFEMEKALRARTLVFLGCETLHIPDLTNALAQKNKSIEEGQTIQMVNETEQIDRLNRTTDVGDLGSGFSQFDAPESQTAFLRNQGMSMDDSDLKSFNTYMHISKWFGYF